MADSHPKFVEMAGNIIELLESELAAKHRKPLKYLHAESMSEDGTDHY